MDTIKITQEDKILVIAPHPDDESIGVGGMLSIYAKQCEVWVLTDGSKCQMPNSGEEIIEIRKAEFINAMEYLGVQKYRMFEMEDRCLFQNLDLLIYEDISKFTKIFIPSNHESHIDHVSTYQIAINMLKAQKIVDKEIYLYEITAPMKSFNCMLDISKVIENKKNCIQIYDSQIRIYDYVGAASSLNRFRACMAGMFNAYIEVYNLIELESNEIMDNDRALSMSMTLEKYKGFVKILDKWIQYEASQLGIEYFLLENNWKNVSIYGFGILGKRLYEILTNSQVSVDYVMDKREFPNKSNFLLVEQDMPQTDLIIVTAIFDYKNIKNMLIKRGHKNILSLLEIINKLENIYSLMRKETK